MSIFKQSAKEILESLAHCFFWHLAKEIRATAKEILGFLAELPKNFEKIFSLSAKKCEHFQAKCQRNFGKFGSNAKGLLPEKKTVFSRRNSYSAKPTAKEILDFLAVLPKKI